MKWTHQHQGKNNPPKWLKTCLTLLYRGLFGLLVLELLAFLMLPIFGIPVSFQVLRACLLTGGLTWITDALRIWLFRLPAPIKLHGPVPYGQPGWSGALQSLVACGCILLLAYVLFGQL